MQEKIYYSNIDNYSLTHRVIELAESLQIAQSAVELGRLKSRWNRANNGFTDIEDLDVLYDCVCEAQRSYDKALARYFDQRRHLQIHNTVLGYRAKYDHD